MPSEQSPTLALLRNPLFNAPDHYLSERDHAILSYQRAKAIGTAYQMDIHDIGRLGPKFWALHSDPMAVFDGATTTLLTIHYNLVLGTLSQYYDDREDLHSLVDDLLEYRTIGQFFLTELGHGLDAENLETTATLTSSGDFILHTPRAQAAKFMPPSIPAGLPCVGIVFARYIVSGVFYGIRPFIVEINDGVQMCPGVSARLLPARGGSNPVNHSLTSFTHVRLPRTALLGSFDKSANIKDDFTKAIWRVAVGSLALGIVGVKVMEVSCTIGTMYSLRRTTGSPASLQVPILQYRTQQIPLLVTVAKSYVLRAFSRWAVSVFSDAARDSRVRHGVAACAKAVIVEHSQTATIAISDRCGAQGLFASNQMCRFFNEMRGIAIAEGDILALSIRLAIELILGRYELPRSSHPTSLLARHETHIFTELRDLTTSFTSHRQDVNRHILPRCLSYVEAMGHRMAYDAALDDEVDSSLINLYVSSIIKHDSAWYAEEAGLGRQAQIEMETNALDAVLPRLVPLVHELGVEPYVTAPIVSDSAWQNFVDGLTEFKGFEDEDGFVLADQVDVFGENETVELKARL